MMERSGLDDVFSEIAEMISAERGRKEGKVRKESVKEEEKEEEVREVREDKKEERDELFEREERDEFFEDVITEINFNKKKLEKLVKERKIVRARELGAVKRLPSGVFMFDLLTGGGLPLGKFSMFSGEKSTGKSTFALRIAKSFLRRDRRNVLYFDFEDTFDAKWAEKILGSEAYLDRIYVAKPSFLEEGIDIFDSLRRENEFENIGLVIVDSLASMIPLSEVEADADQAVVGVLARGINKFLRKALSFSVAAMREGKPVTFLLINQVRIGFGMGMRMPQEVKPGGKYQEALVSLDVKFIKGSVHRDKDSDIPLLVEYKFKVEKNKTGGIPDVVGSYTMCLVDTESYRQGDIIDAPQILAFAKKLGFLEEGKGTSKWKFLGEEYRTQKEIIDRLKEEEEYKEKVIEELCRFVYENLSVLRDVKRKEK